MRHFIFMTDTDTMGGERKRAPQRLYFQKRLIRNLQNHNWSPSENGRIKRVHNSLKQSAPPLSPRRGYSISSSTSERQRTSASTKDGIVAESA